MLELSLGVGACGRMASPSPPTPAGWGRRRGGRNGERGQELGDIQAQGKTKAEARGRGLGGSVCPNVAPGGVDFYAQAWRIWLRAAFGLRWGSSGALGGVRESFWASFWALRRSFWSSREVILESPKVMFELLRVIFLL